MRVCVFECGFECVLEREKQQQFNRPVYCTGSLENEEGGRERGGGYSIKDKEEEKCISLHE